MERGDELKTKYKTIPKASRYFPIHFPMTMSGNPETKHKEMIPEGVIA